MKKIGKINNIPIVQGQTNEIKNQIKADIDNNGKITLSKRADNGNMESISQGGEIFPLKSIFQCTQFGMENVDIEYGYSYVDSWYMQLRIYLKKEIEDETPSVNISDKCTIFSGDTHPDYPSYYSEKEKCFYISYISSAFSFYIIYNNKLYTGGYVSVM